MYFFICDGKENDLNILAKINILRLYFSIIFV